MIVKEGRVLGYTDNYRDALESAKAIGGTVKPAEEDAEAKRHYMSLEDCKILLGKYCSFLTDSDIDCADFRFTDVSDVFGMVSFIGNSYILVDENFGLKIKDVGSGDVSPKFEHPLYFVKHRKGRAVEYMPVNASISDFLKRFNKLLENDYYLILDESKIGNALSTVDHNYVVIGSLSIGGEDFFEYLGGLHLKEKGYFVTKWNPVGGSDFFAYRIPEYAEALQRIGVIKNGAFLSELELFPLIKHDRKPASPANNHYDMYDIIVCEAEAQYNLALRSNTGIGQKIGWIDQQHEVYGVGPTTYVPDAKNIHKYFGKRVGAIVFTNTHEKIEITPIESGFSNENYEIETIKLLIKSIFAHKSLLPQKSTKHSIKSHIQDIKRRHIEEILQNL